MRARCRLRSAAPSSHHTGLRSPRATFTASTRNRAAFRAAGITGLKGNLLRPPRRHEFADKFSVARHRDAGSRSAIGGAPVSLLMTLGGCRSLVRA